MSGTFDFALGARVAEELPPEEASATSFNGWEFTSKPSVPYRRMFNVTLNGMRWYMNAAGTGLDINTNPQFNVGRLLYFYQQNRTWDVFGFNHEYLGNLVCRFASPVTVPKALPNSRGLIDALTVKLVHYNPAFT